MQSKNANINYSYSAVINFGYRYVKIYFHCDIFSYCQVYKIS